MHRPATGFHTAFDDGETEARAARFAGARGFGAVEGFKEARQAGLGTPGPSR